MRRFISTSASGAALLLFAACGGTDATPVTGTGSENADSGASDDGALGSDTPSPPIPSDGALDPDPSDTGTSADAAPTPTLASPGCNKPALTGDLQHRTTTVAGGMRTYWLHAPAAFTNTTAEKLVFVWHGCNMSVDGIRSSLTVEAAAKSAGDNALFVYPQIINSSDSNAGYAAGETCFDWTRDAAYFDAVLADVESTYCVDTNKVFSTGYSSGAILSENIGCERSNVVRAIAPAEGGFGSKTTACAGKVDALIIHSPLDEQIGWITGAPQTATNPNAWTDGRGYVPYSLLYANSGCTAPALDPNDATIGQITYTCSGHRLSRWLHDYQVPASFHSNTPHHWFPPEAPATIWKFFAATP